MAKKILKWGGITLGSIILLLLVALGSIYLIGQSKINQTYDVEIRPVSIPPDTSAVAAGQHVARTRGCFACHGEQLEGSVFIDNGAMGRIIAANLTSGKGGIGRHYDDRDWIRAIRHGINREGKSMVIMPSDEYFHLSDEDLGHLIAYLKQLPPVDNPLPQRDFGPVPHFISVFDNNFLKAAKISHTAASAPKVMPGVTVEYGAYLAINCQGCHQADLTGGKPPFPGAPPAANITPDPINGIGKWSKVDFIRSLREGIRPDGRELDESMPRFFRYMTDEEISALWLYLQSLRTVQHSRQQ